MLNFRKKTPDFSRSFKVFRKFFGLGVTSPHIIWILRRSGTCAKFGRLKVWLIHSVVGPMVRI